MLKWAVHEAKTSYLPDAEQKENHYDLYYETHALYSNRANSLIELNSSAAIYSSATKSHLKRKTSDVPLLSRRRQSLQFLSDYNCNYNNTNNNNNIDNENNNKGNQITSTPLNDASSTAQYYRGDHNNESLRKLNSLKDLSNIVPECKTNNGTSVDKSQRRKTQEWHLPKTPERIIINKENNEISSCLSRTQHAPTLPTFNVEYSPNGLIPGPILAMRGLGGIADMYFEKPRYIDHMSTWNIPKDDEQTPNVERASSKMSANCNHQTCCADVNHGGGGVRGVHRKETLTSSSSSQLSDSALEKMIDAIIASTRKEHKIPRLSRQLSHHNNNNNNFYTMSPTYKSAYDPANDLNEFWPEDTQVRKPRKLFPFNEREVRSPKSNLGVKRDTNLNLKRQRAVRRKRRNAKIRQSLKSALQSTMEIKPFIGITQQSTNSHSQETPRKTPKGNLSPDSGHNSSSSDSCILEEDTTLKACKAEDPSTTKKWKEPDLRHDFR